jgi:hypothetical protein
MFLPRLFTAGVSKDRAPQTVPSFFNDANLYSPWVTTGSSTQFSVGDGVGIPAPRLLLCILLGVLLLVVKSQMNHPAASSGVSVTVVDT